MIFKKSKLIKEVENFVKDSLSRGESLLSFRLLVCSDFSMIEEFKDYYQEVFVSEEELNPGEVNYFGDIIINTLGISWDIYYDSSEKGHLVCVNKDLLVEEEEEWDEEYNMEEYDLEEEF